VDGVSAQVWSFIVTIVGVIGFFLAGKKIWWAWYVNIFCQVLWVIFALVSGLYGFLLGTIPYTIVFVKNAISWTREYRAENVEILDLREFDHPVIKMSLDDNFTPAMRQAREQISVLGYTPRTVSPRTRDMASDHGEMIFETCSGYGMANDGLLWTDRNPKCTITTPHTKHRLRYFN
jgi:hypothetical protein